MKFKKHVLITAVLAFLISGCTNTPAIMVKAGSGEQTVAAKSGKPFAIRLQAQLSTGYSWKLAELPASVTIVKEAIITDSKDNDKTGGFEIQEFVLKSMMKGDLTLTFNYAQHWKKKPEFAKTTTVNVSVE
jgi:predicted secreted protein